MDVTCGLEFQLNCCSSSLLGCSENINWPCKTWIFTAAMKLALGTVTEQVEQDRCTVSVTTLKARFSLFHYADGNKNIFIKTMMDSSFLNTPASRNDEPESRPWVIVQHPEDQITLNENASTKCHRTGSVHSAVCFHGLSVACVKKTFYTSNLSVFLLSLSL